MKYMISWFITDLRLGWLIILVIAIWLASSIIDDTNSDNEHPWTFIIVTVMSVLSIVVLAFGIAKSRIISESTQPWNQVYKNDLNALVRLSNSEQSLTIGKQLTDKDARILSEMHYSNNIVTITIGENDNTSSRKVRITSIEGDLTENMVITNIEYRRSTTFHYHALGFDGNSQPSDYDGDIRITIGRSNNATNSLFGD